MPLRGWIEGQGWEREEGIGREGGKWGLLPPASRGS